MRRITTLLACVAGGAMGAAPAVSARTLDVPAGNSAAMVSAIDQARRGDAVHLPAGRYALVSALAPNSGVRLLGDGIDKTILKFAGNDDAPAMVRLQDVVDVEVAGLTLDGQNSRHLESGVFAANAKRIHLHDLKVMDIAKGEAYGPFGVHFTGDDPSRRRGVTESEVVRCAFENIGVGAEYGGGIRLSWGSGKNRIIANTIRDTGRGGIFCNDGCADVLVRDNTVSGSGGEGLGIELWHGCDRGVVEGNRVDHWISLDGSDRCAFRRNRVADASGAYKFIGLELVNANRAVFTDNVVEGGQHVGISLSGKGAKEYTYWGYDRISKCDTWAAQLQGEEGGIAHHYFYHCAFNDTVGKAGKPLYPDDSGHGLRTNGHVHGVTFDGCEFAGNSGIGIQLGGKEIEGLSFVDCSLHDNHGPAVTGPAAAMEWTNLKAERNGGSPPPAHGAPATARPAVNVTAPAEGRAGERLAFAAKPAAGGTFAAVLWDFGDGPPATEAEAPHEYESAGKYRVTVIAWDAAGRAARVEKEVEIKGGSPSH